MDTTKPAKDLMSMGFVFEWSDDTLVESFRSAPSLDQVKFERLVRTAAEQRLPFGVILMPVGGGWSGSSLYGADEGSLGAAVDRAVEYARAMGGVTQWVIALKDADLSAQVERATASKHKVSGT